MFLMSLILQLALLYFKSYFLSGPAEHYAHRISSSSKAESNFGSMSFLISLVGGFLSEPIIDVNTLVNALSPASYCYLYLSLLNYSILFGSESKTY